MVDVFGNEIIKAYTGGTPVKEIYAYGVLVWPTGYYIFWTPMSMSGTFTMEGETYNFEDYSGSFRFSGGVITSSAFQSTSVEYINTNATLTFHNAFAFCSSLVSAELPNCSAVWTNCFTNCTSLESISLPVCTLIGGNAFESCKFSYLDLPMVETIEGNGFRHCKSLTSVDLPECSSVGQYAFQDCTSLKTINLPKCTNIEQGAFGGDREIESVSLPECSVIGSSAFTYCTSFSYLELMGSSMCQLVGNDQFYNTPFANCSGIIRVPASLLSQYRTDSKWMSLSCVLRRPSGSYYISWTPTDLSGTFTMEGNTYNFEDYNGYFNEFDGIITKSAFRQQSITYVETDAISVEVNAFTGCSLSDIDLLECTYIGDNAFGYCRSLTEINLPKCSIIDNFAFMNCVSLSIVYIPECISIGWSTFNACSSLKSINLPKCRTVGTHAFENCKSLEQISLPECRTIDFRAFFGCSSLNQISLPVCEYIEGECFINCQSLSYIQLGLSSVCSLNSSNAFSGTQITSSTGSILVPASLVDAYKSAVVWSYFSNRIFGI